MDHREELAAVGKGDCLIADISGGQHAGLRTVWIAHGRTRQHLDSEPTHVAHDVVEAATWLLANPPRPQRPSPLSLVGG
ncbi:HAD hydrolase-like protein [Streptomyces ardesiacus]